MIEKLEQIKKECTLKIQNSKNLNEINNIKIEFFGKKGFFTEIMKELKDVPKEERPKVGKIINDYKSELLSLLEKNIKDKEEENLNEILIKESIDVTMPSRKKFIGNVHPLYKVQSEISKIFKNMGFSIFSGPEVESDYFNFEALNTPFDHPSKDLQDTLYIDDNDSDLILLRTQTSPVQIRTMLKEKPPLKMICPGRVYRKDEVDASHSPVFHQVEGLVVDKNIHIGNLKATIDEFNRQMFGNKVKSRFRPHFFPFTEPSVEIDISCIFCKGSGCRVCKDSGWIEIMGAGMVDTRVFNKVNIDTEIYSGFAFGMGVERITMLKYEINNMRLLFENNISFLKQF